MCFGWIKTLIPFITIVYFSLLTGCSPSDDSISEPENGETAVIYLDQVQQLIKGFGGVNMPGWISDMTPDMVNKAFGTGDGQIGLSILRVRVPYDSTAFNLEIPTAKLAKSLGAIIIASPWTPPPVFKSNNNIVGGYLKDDSYAAYAAYLKSFADYMSKNGAPLYALSVQNEPDVSVTYESCDYNSAQMVKFIKNNTSFIGTKIIAPESYKFDPLMADAILNDADAASKVAIIGGHTYEGIVSYPRAAEKGKELWQTEHLVVNTDFNGALATAKEINDCMNAGMNAYLWWYIRRYYGPIDDNGIVTKRGFMMAQYARFIRPGFYKVNATAKPKNDIYVTAYKNGSKIVITAINWAFTPIQQTFTLKNGTAVKFSTYITSESKNCEKGNDAVVSNGSFTFTLPDGSVTTFVSE